MYCVFRHRTSLKSVSGFNKAAEDLNLRPIDTTPAALGTHTLLHAPHKQPNLTCGELIVPSVGYRQPEPTKPVGTAKVIQKVGQFGPKVGCSVT